MGVVGEDASAAGRRTENNTEGRRAVGPSVGLFLLRHHPRGDRDLNAHRAPHTQWRSRATRGEEAEEEREARQQNRHE